MEPVVPLRAIAFQCLFLLVAIALEAAVLRQKLRLPFKTSIEYAASVNLLTASLGWFVLLALEPILPQGVQQQLISYVLFDRFFGESWNTSVVVWLLAAAVLAFFGTFLTKLKGLDALRWLLNEQPQSSQSQLTSRQERYGRARRGRIAIAAPSRQALAVLQANALSFSAILLLLLLRTSLVSIGDLS